MKRVKKRKFNWKHAHELYMKKGYLLSKDGVKFTRAIPLNEFKENKNEHRIYKKRNKRLKTMADFDGCTLYEIANKDDKNGSISFCGKKTFIFLTAYIRRHFNSLSTFNMVARKSIYPNEARVVIRNKKVKVNKKRYLKNEISRGGFYV